MKILTITTVLLFLAACTPAIQGSPTKTFNPQPAATIRSVQPLATPTDIQLPFNDKNVDQEHCRIPDVKLSISEANGLNEDEIAGQLMKLLLAYFSVPKAPDYCRIAGYRIDKVYYDERTSSLPLEPKGDFIRVVHFSIKLIQIPNMWMPWSGEIDRQNWLHTGNFVAVFHSSDGYTMKFANP